VQEFPSTTALRRCMVYPIAGIGARIVFQFGRHRRTWRNIKIFTPFTEPESDSIDQLVAGLEWFSTADPVAFARFHSATRSIFLAAGAGLHLYLRYNLVYIDESYIKDQAPHRVALSLVSLSASACAARKRGSAALKFRPRRVDAMSARAQLRLARLMERQGIQDAQFYVEHFADKRRALRTGP
jgi:hypothetical protein